MENEPEELNGTRFDHCGGSGPVERAAWPVFVKAMRGRMYGQNETSDAWAWFLKGFAGGANEVEQLRTALQKLRNEAAGVAGMTEARTVFGNTNLACLEQRIQEADRLLQTKVTPCIGNDPMCPCQDGDMCHYKGPNAWPLPEKDTP